MSRTKLIELPYTTREERIQALVELYESTKSAALTATGRAKADLTAIQLRCLKQIQDEMEAVEDDALIERAENLTTTLESGVARPSLAKTNKPSQA